jgi:DNA-binding CsgD family transcriptional regulator
MRQDAESRRAIPDPYSIQTESGNRREDARLILSGSSDKEIAYRLGISVSTVSNHNGRLYRKLGVASRLELLAMGWAGRP